MIELGLGRVIEVCFSVMIGMRSSVSMLKRLRTFEVVDLSTGSNPSLELLLARLFLGEKFVSKWCTPSCFDVGYYETILLIYLLFTVLITIDSNNSII